MIRRTFSAAVIGVALVSVLAATGCLNPTYGPHLGIFAYPIPLTPYLQDQQEDRAWEKERYEKVPILEPFTPGGPTVALDPPSQDEVMRALERARPAEGGLPFMYETQRNNVRIVTEQIADSVDPPRVYPLIGPAQLHHARYKCTVYFSDVTRVGWPIPYTTKNEDAQEVIYIDHDHLHMVGNVDAGSGNAPGVGGSAVPPVPSPAIGSTSPSMMPFSGPVAPGPAPTNAMMPGAGVPTAGMAPPASLPPSGPFRMTASR